MIKWRQRYMFKALHVWCHNSRLGHEIFCLVRYIGVYEYLEWLHHLQNMTQINKITKSRILWMNDQIHNSNFIEKLIMSILCTYSEQQPIQDGHLMMCVFFFSHIAIQNCNMSNMCETHIVYAQNHPLFTKIHTHRLHHAHSRLQSFKSGAITFFRMLFCLAQKQTIKN